MHAGEQRPDPEKVKLVITEIEQRGILQKDIAEICKVSPSDVCSWKGKADNKPKAFLPNKEKYERLLSILEPKAPGKSFHYRKIVRNICSPLAEDWQEQILLQYYKNNCPLVFGHTSSTDDPIVRAGNLIKLTPKTDLTLKGFVDFTQKTIQISGQTVPIKKAFEEWLLTSMKAKSITLENEEINISGKIIYETTPPTPDSDNYRIEYELFSLYSGNLVLLKNISLGDWDSTNITYIPKCLTTQDILDEIGEYANRPYPIENGKQQHTYSSLKEALLDHGYYYPGVRTIL
jgi:hypothetical protein